MLPILNIIKHLNSKQLRELVTLINQFARSVERLAADTEKEEKFKKELEHHKLRKYEKTMLQKLKLQRAIMTRYQQGYSLEHIGSCLSYHPKTIARYIRKFQTDFTILKEIDRDLNRAKIKMSNTMLKSGMTKAQIVQKLHVSAHYIQHP